MLRDKNMAEQAHKFREMLRNRELPDATIGAVFREYVLESDHGGWDGFARRDLTGIERMLTDFSLYLMYHESYLEGK